MQLTYKVKILIFMTGLKILGRWYWNRLYQIDELSIYVVPLRLEAFCRHCCLDIIISFKLELIPSVSVCRELMSPFQRISIIVL
jgi:hypothetical protein